MNLKTMKQENKFDKVIDWAYCVQSLFNDLKRYGTIFVIATTINPRDVIIARYNRNYLFFDNKLKLIEIKGRAEVFENSFNLYSIFELSYCN
jgi:hypothetical protein